MFNAKSCEKCFFFQDVEEFKNLIKNSINFYVRKAILEL